MSDAKLFIEIGAKTKEFEEALSHVAESTEHLESKLGTIAKISAVAFAAVTGEIALSIHAYAGAEDATRKLSLALQNQGIFSDGLLESYKKQADSLQDLTGVDNDAILKGDALLQSFIGQTAITEELNKAVLNLAAGTGKNLNSAFELVGRGATENTRALKQLGIEVDASLTKEERLAKIVEIVTVKFGDQAAAANRGIGGIKGLERAFDDIQKELGARFAPAVSFAIEKITLFLREIKNNSGLLNFIAAVLAGTAAITGVIAAVTTASVVIGSLSTIAGALGISLVALVAALGPVALALGAAAAGVALIALKSQDASEAQTELEKKIVNTRDGLKRLQELAASPVKSALTADLKKDIEDAKAQLADYEEQLRRIPLLVKAQTVEQDPEKKRLADLIIQEKNYIESIKQRKKVAEGALLVLESQQASKEVIDLKKKEIEILTKLEDEKYKKVRGYLKNYLEDVRSLQITAEENDLTRRDHFQDTVLRHSETFQRLSAEQQSDFLVKNGQALIDSLETEQTARDDAAKDEIERQIKKENQLAKDRQKYGSVIATVKSIVNLEVVASIAASGLQALTQLASSYDTQAEASKKIKAQTEEDFAARQEQLAALQLQEEEKFQAEFDAGNLTQDQLTAATKANKKYYDQLTKEELASYNQKKAANEEADAQAAKTKAENEAARSLISGALSAVAEVLVPGAGAFVGQMLALFNQGPEAIRKAFTAILDAIPVVLTTIVESIPVFIETLGKELPKIITILSEEAPRFISALIDALPAFVINFVTEFIAQIPNIVAGFIKGLIEVPAKFVEALFNAVKNIFTGGENGAGSTVGKGIIEGPLAPFIAIGNAIKGEGFHLAEGGRVPGSGSGDTVRAMLTPGELVVPPQSFEETVNAVAASRAASSSSGSRSGAGQWSGGVAQVQIGFEGREAERILTARQVEARALGISTDGMAIA